MSKIVNDFINAILVSELTQKEIALRSGIHENTIIGWVTKKFIPSMGKASNVAKAIGMEFIICKKI